MTPVSNQRGDTITTYLRRTLKRLKHNKSPFTAPLQVSVALDEIGLSSITSELFKNLDLNQPIEKLIYEILKNADQNPQALYRST